MNAFHSNWTGPFVEGNKGKEYEVDDFELLTTIISALKWQEFNGDIEMITDKRGAQYYRALGLEDLWNKGINEALEEINQEIDKKTFWAAGKLYALALQKEPCVMLDTDFIVWKNIESQLITHDVVVIHKERIEPQIYPDKKELHVKGAYHYPKEWDWQVEPCNTAFSFFKDQLFKEYYIEEALRFMKAVQAKDPLIYMVFAEQRLLAMCAKEKKIDLYTLATTEALFHKQQQYFTHVWGHKKFLRKNDQARGDFCKRCIARIKRDYPYFYPKLLKIEALKGYL